jgi:hypothetical protein
MIMTDFNDASSYENDPSEYCLLTISYLMITVLSTGHRCPDLKIGDFDEERLLEKQQVSFEPQMRIFVLYQSEDHGLPALNSK